MSKPASSRNQTIMFSSLMKLLIKLLIAISWICHLSNPTEKDAIANLLIRLYIEAISRLAVISANFLSI